MTFSQAILDGNNSIVSRKYIKYIKFNTENTEKIFLLQFVPLSLPGIRPQDGLDLILWFIGALTVRMD